MTKELPKLLKDAIKQNRPDVEIITNAGGKRAVEWITPKSNDPTGKWSQKYFNGESDIGIKYIVEYLPKGEWACVRQLGVNKPEILAIETKGSTLTSDDVKKVTVTRSFSETAVSPRVRTKYRADSGDRWQYSTYQNFRLNVSVDMRFPKISGEIKYELLLKWNIIFIYIIFYLII